MKAAGMPARIISADSHIVEPGDCYGPRMAKEYRDEAPQLVHDEKLGDVYVIPGIKRPVQVALAAAAGKKPEELKAWGASFEELPRGGWDPAFRLADQDRDGVDSEIIYPTLGMILCNHRNLDYKKALFDAYNLWIAEYCSFDNERLVGLGQTAVRSVEEGIEDLRAIKALGLRGVMMPGTPGTVGADDEGFDYDDERFGPFWEASVELGLPLAWHILTTRETAPTRGPKMNSFLSIIRANQDILGTLVLGGVFQRHPGLKVVCAEADAGWVPHYMYRMDHAYKRHRFHLKAGAELDRLPSEYFREHIYLTFQDDWVAFQVADKLNPHRLCWANDFPHSDSTWPWSQEMLAEQTRHLTPDQVNWVLHDNIAELYHLA